MLEKTKETFFTQSKNSLRWWICQCGKSCKVTGSGYSNVVTHIQNIYLEEYKILSESFTDSRQATISTSATSSSSELVISKEIFKRIYASLELCTAGLQAFRILTNKVITKNLRFTPMDEKPPKESTCIALYQILSTN